MRHGELREGFISSVLRSVRFYANVRGELGRMELCFLLVQEIGAVSTEAGIKVVVGVKRWICHC